MRDRRIIELLSPAKNAECAIAAIKAGADAVYMGASSFGARSLAGNSFDAIKKSADFAHLFGARVYITLNTILFDGEVEQARETAFKACDAGADALIIQDMGLMNGELPPIELHASTQCNIRTPEKAKFLEDAGFDTLVLARELSLKEIDRVFCPRGAVRFIQRAMLPKPRNRRQKRKPRRMRPALQNALLA